MRHEDAARRDLDQERSGFLLMVWRCRFARYGISTLDYATKDLAYRYTTIYYARTGNGQYLLTDRAAGPLHVCTYIAVRLRLFALYIREIHGKFGQFMQRYKVQRLQRNRILCTQYIPSRTGTVVFDIAHANPWS